MRTKEIFVTLFVTANLAVAALAMAQGNGKGNGKGGGGDDPDGGENTTLEVGYIDVKGRNNNPFQLATVNNTNAERIWTSAVDGRPTILSSLSSSGTNRAVVLETDLHVIEWTIDASGFASEGELVRVLDQSAQANCGGISPDGTHVAAGIYLDGKLYRYNVASGAREVLADFGPNIAVAACDHYANDKIVFATVENPLAHLDEATTRLYLWDANGTGPAIVSRIYGPDIGGPANGEAVFDLSVNPATGDVAFQKRVAGIGDDQLYVLSGSQAAHFKAGAMPSYDCAGERLLYRETGGRSNATLIYHLDNGMQTTFDRRGDVSYAEWYC